MALKKGAAAQRPRLFLCTLVISSPAPRLVWTLRSASENKESKCIIWSCEVSFKGPPPVQLVLHQQVTNQHAAVLSHPSAGVTLHELSSSRLISALQKNVRLCRPTAALRVAWSLIRLSDPSGSSRSGAVELLRRLPIIAFEDGLPPPLLPELVWLMMAHSSTKAPLPLSATLINLLLSATLQLAACRWREDEHAAAPVVGEEEGRPTLSLADTAASCDGSSSFDDDASSEVVRAALLRAGYGGMPGDMKMLHAAAQIWGARGASDRRGWGSRLRKAATPTLLVAKLVAEALAGPVAAATDGCGEEEASLRAALRGDGGLRWDDLPVRWDNQILFSLHSIERFSAAPPPLPSPHPTLSLSPCTQQ